MDTLQATTLQNVVHHVLFDDGFVVVCGGFIVMYAGGVPRGVVVLVAAQQYHVFEVSEAAGFG